MASPLGTFFGELLFAGLFVVGMAQKVQQIVDHAVITLFGAINGKLGQVVAQHVFRIDGVHAATALRLAEAIAGSVLNQLEDPVPMIT